MVSIGNLSIKLVLLTIPKQLIMNRPIKFLVILSIVFISGILINATQNTSETTKDDSNTEVTKSDKNTSDLYEIKALKILKE